MALLLATGCASTPKAAPPAAYPKPVARPVVDAKAQQLFYDKGLRLYSEENYDGARSAFQQVVELGADTALGLKAEENIRKIDQILETLKEIESK
ncbi:MAG TPA: hypothetical protein VL122_09360 [Nitrospirota bacterium]|nr:hypothetical protein [Nitrospirota bacterium]